MNGSKLINLVMLGIVVLLAGCKTGPPAPPRGWEKSGASEQEFMRDHYSCIQEASSRVVRGSATANTPYSPGYQSNISSQVLPSCQMYHACIMARGYRGQDYGRFTLVATCNKP